MYSLLLLPEEIRVEEGEEDLLNPALLVVLGAKEVTSRGRRGPGEPGSAGRTRSKGGY